MWHSPESLLEGGRLARMRRALHGEAATRAGRTAARLGASLLPVALADRCISLDRRWAIALHRGADSPLALIVLIAASRLGDGLMWVAIGLAIPLLGGPQGIPCAIQMAGVFIANLLVYALLKRRVGRARPYVACPGVRACARALDRFSFPSGHTLHAVAFAVLLSHHYPLFTVPLWIFAALVMASRVVLGLHYPSDVAAGALIGAISALIALAIPISLVF
jgi:undecaprenyl-diphosphatase